MLYIALVDIYSKAVDGFTTANGDEDMSFIWATLSFFLGAVIMLVLDKVVYLLLQWEMKRIGVNLNDCNDEQAAVAGIITGSAEDPAQALRNMKKRFEDKLNAKREIEKVIKDDQHHGDVENNAGDEERSVSTERLTDATLTTDPKHAQPLRHMGFAMALAVAIHNLPEGMVTYLAYVEEPAVGVALAVGIAIHNIPEGTQFRLALTISPIVLFSFSPNLFFCIQACVWQCLCTMPRESVCTPLCGVR
jgi:ZIP family zinc transporter